LPFVVKLLIGRHKVAMTLIYNGASLNLIIRKTFIEMGLNLEDLTSVHDTFHDVIPGQTSTPLEMLTFEDASFDIGYNCILRRPFSLKLMAVIHTAYGTIKMPSPKGIITIKADQRDALACENTSLSHASQFGEKATQE
jgi:hypothetical protein